MKKIEAIIFAAGESLRYGVNKLLLPIGDRPALLHAVHTLRVAGVDEVTLITGVYHEEIQQAFVGEKVRIIFNPQYKQGMSSTVRFSVEHIRQNSASIFFLPGDVPLFSERTIKAMVQQNLKHRIVIPMYHKKKGHPVLLDRKIAKECLDADLEMPLYEVIRKHQNEVYFLDCDDQGVVLDIDTSEDYKTILDYFKTTYGSN